MYCKYAEYACKLQPNLSMNNKQGHDVQKKCNIVLLLKNAEYPGICPKKLAHDQQKRNMINKK